METYTRRTQQHSQALHERGKNREASAAIYFSSELNYGIAHAFLQRHGRLEPSSGYVVIN